MAIYVSFIFGGVVAIYFCLRNEFVNRWSEAGPTHHMAAASGRHIDTILKVAKIFNVPVDVITR